MLRQHRTMDEIDAGAIQERWLGEVCGRIKDRPSEVKVDRGEGDTSVTSVWTRGRPKAWAIRQRDDQNWTILTMIEAD